MKEWLVNLTDFTEMNELTLIKQKAIYTFIDNWKPLMDSCIKMEK